MRKEMFLALMVGLAVSISVGAVDFVGIRDLDAVGTHINTSEPSGGGGARCGDSKYWDRRGLRLRFAGGCNRGAREGV